MNTFHDISLFRINIFDANENKNAKIKKKEEKKKMIGYCSSFYCLYLEKNTPNNNNKHTNTALLYRNLGFYCYIFWSKKKKKKERDARKKFEYIVIGSGLP